MQTRMTKMECKMEEVCETLKKLMAAQGTSVPSAPLSHSTATLQSSSLPPPGTMVQPHLVYQSPFAPRDAYTPTSRAAYEPAAYYPSAYPPPPFQLTQHYLGHISDGIGPMRQVVDHGGP